MIRRISIRQKKRLMEYQKVLKEWRKTARYCAFPGCWCKTVDPHHTRGRVGKLLCDSRYFVPLCFEHHNFVHQNPKKARELGLLCAKGEWGKQE